MTGAVTTPVPDESDAVFDVAVNAIPIGVRCRSCGWLHLPARLRPLAMRPREGGGVLVDLRCVRCNAPGSLLPDAESTEHRGLLAVWLDQSERTPGEDSGKVAT